MLKMYGINISFHQTRPLLLKKYVLYTQFNVDNYGQTISLMLHTAMEFCFPAF